MPNPKRSNSLIPVLLLGWLGLSAGAWAGGPLLLCDPATRTPFGYADGGVNPDVLYFLDPGTLGPLTNAQADALAAASFAEWSGVASSTFDAALGGDEPSDVTLANVAAFIGVFNGGGIDVIYDDDGSILQNFFGLPPGVLGIATPEFGNSVTCAIIESWAVLNGARVNADDASMNAGANFGGVVTHELGHSINLAHTQTNGGIFFGPDEIGPNGCPTPYAGIPLFADAETMMPFLDVTPIGFGANAATVDHPDDVASLSNVNPAAGWPPTNGTISGTIFLGNGTEATGINVIARNVADPFGDAISALSGDFTQGALGPDGAYALHGLTPGADYVVYADAIVAGGFSTPQAPFSVPEDYYDAAESNAEDRCIHTLVSPSGTARDITLNTIFADGFESGDTSAWTSTTP